MTTTHLPDDELALLGRTCHELLAKAGGVDRVRALRDAGQPLRFAASLWEHIAELGWLGITAPEDHGGAGGGCRAVLPVLEAAGAALAPEPLLSTVLAIRLLARAGSAAQRDRWLPPIMDGTAIPAVVGAHEHRSRAGGGAPRLIQGPHGPMLDGTARYVLDAALASVLLVVVEGPHPQLVVLPAGVPGVRLASRKLIDLRNWACVEFTRVPVPDADAEAGGALDQALESALDEATVGLAGEMLGAMWALFDRTLEHARGRVQFGRPIGSFQAVAHRLARLYADLLLTDACVREAADALDTHRPDAPALASAAKLRCVLSSRLVCREGIQLHGGMGVTDECDVGLFVKNLRVAEFYLGDHTWHADRWAALAAGPDPTEVDR